MAVDQRWELPQVLLARLRNDYMTEERTSAPTRPEQDRDGAETEDDALASPGERDIQGRDRDLAADMRDREAALRDREAEARDHAAGDLDRNTGDRAARDRPHEAGGRD